MRSLVLSNHPVLSYNDGLFDLINIHDVMDKAVVNEKQKAILNLKYQGYKQHEISEKLDIPRSTVALELKEIKKEIRRLMEL